MPWWFRQSWPLGLSLKRQCRNPSFIMGTCMLLVVLLHDSIMLQVFWKRTWIMWHLYSHHLWTSRGQRGSTLSLAQLSPLWSFIGKWAYHGQDVWTGDVSPPKWLSGVHYMPLGEVKRHYPLNAHVKSLLGIGPEFCEMIKDEILIDDERLWTISDVESNSDEEVDPVWLVMRPKGVNLWRIS